MEPIQLWVCAKNGKVIAVHNNGEPIGFVHKASRRCDTGDIPQILKRIPIAVIPNRAGISGPINASHLLGNEMGGETKLFRQRHVDVIFGNPVEVGVSDIYKKTIGLGRFPAWSCSPSG